MHWLYGFRKWNVFVIRAWKISNNDSIHAFEHFSWKAFNKTCTWSPQVNAVRRRDSQCVKFTHSSVLLLLLLIIVEARFAYSKRLVSYQHEYIRFVFLMALFSLFQMTIALFLDFIYNRIVSLIFSQRFRFFCWKKCIHFQIHQ